MPASLKQSFFRVHGLPGLPLGPSVVVGTLANHLKMSSV